MFAFVSLASGDVLSKKLLQPRSKRFLPAFSLRIWMASCLAFRSFIHFEFILVYGVRKVVQVHSSVCHCPVFLAPLAEETLFHWIFFPALSKMSWPYVGGSISGFSILFH